MPEAHDEPRFPVTADVDLARVPYVALHRRQALGAGTVRYGRALVEAAHGPDLERIAGWLARAEIHRPLGFSRPPARRQVLRSRLPDGSGTEEAVELLALRDTASGELAGFYLCWASPRARCQEVDYAAGDARAAGAVALLRAGKIATLTWLIALRGAREVHWIRHKRDPETGRYRRHGRGSVVTRAQLVALLRRLERQEGRGGVPHASVALPGVGMEVAYPGGHERVTNEAGGQP